MFDIGWSELLVIGVVALIVVGPKDLPGMFRTLGRFTAKARGMAREFQRAMNDAADQAGVNDVTADLKKATSSKAMGLDALNKAASSFEKWEPGKPRKSDAPKPDPDAPTPSDSATQRLRDERQAAMARGQEARAKEAASAPAAPVIVEGGVEGGAPAAAGGNAGTDGGEGRG